jgi:hypothetical protein
MNIGMLWFDNDPSTDLDAKVKQAAAYYNQKYGKAPNLCYVHPCMLSDGEAQTGEIAIKTNGTVLPNHFWIGINGGTNGSANGAAI